MKTDITSTFHKQNVSMMTTKNVLLILLISLCTLPPLSAQRSLLDESFCGLSTNTATPIGNADSLQAALTYFNDLGINRLRIELCGEQPLPALDTLLSFTDKSLFDVFVAVPDTLLTDTLIASLPALVNAANHRVAAYTVVRTVYVRPDTFLSLLKTFCQATPAALHGLSVNSANDQLFNTVARLPEIDYMALNCGFREQRWASLDRVREAIGHVFSKMPQLVDNAVRALELPDKPLLIDYLDYPRDRAYHHPGSLVRMRDNVLNCALRLQQQYSETLRGIFLGTWMDDAAAADKRPPSETLYTSDTSTLLLLARKSGEAMQ